jgi:hypothetical protein
MNIIIKNLSYSALLVLLAICLVGIVPSLATAQKSAINDKNFCREYPKQPKDFQTKYRGLYLKNCLKQGPAVAAPPIKEQSRAVPPASQPGQSAPPSQQAQDPKKDDKKAPDKQPDVTPVKRQPAPSPQPPEIKPAPDKEPEPKRPIPVLRPTLPDTRKGPLPVVKTQQKQAAADLAIAAFKTPASAKAGEDIGKKIQLRISNQGSGTATGSAGSRTRGYTVYLVLSRDQSVPVNVAASAGKFKEDLLLKGGGAVKTRDLASGEQFNFPTADVVIPKDTPAGSYNLCARLDPWNKVKESDERNNTVCRSISIAAPAMQVAVKESTQTQTTAVLPPDSIDAEKWSGQLSQAELNGVAGMLTAHRTINYTHRVYRNEQLQDGRRALTSVSQEAVRGLILMRNTKDLKSLGNGFFDDSQGNLIFSSYLDDDQKSPFSITFTGDGDAVAGIDKTNDGVIDVAFGIMADDRFWMLVNPDFQWMLKCMAASKGNQTVAAAFNCAAGGGSGGSGGGGTFGGGDGNFGGLVDDLRGPECGPDRGFSRVGSWNATAVARNWRNNKQFYIDRSDAHRARSNAIERGEAPGGVDRMIDERIASVRAAAVANATEELAVAIESGDMEAVNSAFEGFLNAKSRYGDALNSLWQPDNENTETGGGSGGGSGSQPAVGPDGGFQDPRCKNQRDPGLLFMSKDFCGEDDMISCLRRQMDPIARSTGGKCWQETGPDDNTAIVCEKYGEPTGAKKLLEEGPGPAGDDDSLGGRPGGRSSGPTDMPGRDTGRSGPVDYGWVETTPLGGVIMSWCNQAGGIGLCGDPLPTDMPTR